MLLRFTLENWMSFQNRVTFNMIASKERNHGQRVAKLDKYNTKILPIAAVYGGNASGKTNFFKALSFAKDLVVRGTNPDSMIRAETFLLNDKDLARPTSFSFELLIDDVVYAYSFEVTCKEVLTEQLVEIGKVREKKLFERKNKKIEFGTSLKNKDFLEFVSKGTRDNQLFVTNSISQRVDLFRPIHDWFKNTLELVAPDSRFEPFEFFIDEDNPFYGTMNEMLRQLDTGILHLGGEEVAFEHIPVLKPIKIKLEEELVEGKTVRLDFGRERLIVSRKNGKMTAKKLVAYHAQKDGSEVVFDIQQESDGTQRIIDLVPAFLELSKQISEKVYVIDEIDRSLHTLLTRRLLESYLANCSENTRSQLLFTTHDVLLLDQELLRRDEIWVTERDASGVSDLFSFSEYKDIRYDKDIRKSYLQGRLGGIPRILLDDSLINARAQKEA